MVACERPPLPLVTVGTVTTSEGVRQAMLRETPGVAFRPGKKLCAFEEGTVGWGADQLDVVLPDAERTTIPARATAVFHQEAGEWKMVHIHVSFGVPDAKLFDLLPQLLS